MYNLIKMITIYIWQARNHQLQLFAAKDADKTARD